MIISVSRRTDIPAFYSDWFFHRLQAGYVLVRNPMNMHQVSKVRLTPDVVDCIVFWTKNPAAMLAGHADELAKLPIPYYFQFTVNPYDTSLEPGVPGKKDVFHTFSRLAGLIGKERVIWRYDPIIVTDVLDFDYHCKYFEIMAKILAPHTNRCVISFLDFYPKLRRNMRGIDAVDPTFEQKLELGRKLYGIASKYGLELFACAEMPALAEVGIRPAQCIDPELIARLCGNKVSAGKDKNQRKECGCVESIDIGTYNSCRHGCVYCYANHSAEAVNRQILLHHPASPLLLGELISEDRIAERKMSRSRRP